MCWNQDRLWRQKQEYLVFTWGWEQGESWIIRFLSWENQIQKSMFEGKDSEIGLRLFEVEMHVGHLGEIVENTV